MRLLGLALLIATLGSACLAAPPDVTPDHTLGPTSQAEPTSSEPPKLDPAAELERVKELRSGWGLRPDEDWIRQVADAPDSVMSELGIAVSPEEAEELAEMVREEPRTRLIFYGAREHETFAGLWVNDPPFDMVMLFTRDLDRHRAAIAALAPQMRVDVRPARFTEAELRRLQQEVVEDLVGMEGVEFLSLGLDTKNNVLELDAKSNDPTLKQRLEERYGGRLVANIHPLPGPWSNVEAGTGWRLLADGRTIGDEAYRVRVATDAGQWHELWRALDQVNPAPAADLESEVVVSFGHGVGSSCPELRLDGVVIDEQAPLVHSLVSDPLEPRICTGDLAGAVYFVVALSRDALPHDSFTLRLRQQLICADRSCGHVEELEVELRP